MSIQRLPSGLYRAQVYDPRTKKNVSVGKILGGASTFTTKAAAKAARADARKLLGNDQPGIVTVGEFRHLWITDPLYARPKLSTNLHNAQQTKAFAAAHEDLPLGAVDDLVVARWLAGGKRRSQVPALRAMFNDAASAKAGRLIARNPFAGLGLKKAKGNADKQPPSEETVRALIDAGGRVGMPAFGAWLQVAAYTGMRPGELDALRWDCVDFDTGRIAVKEQWSATSRMFTSPKNGNVRTALLTPDARAALVATPRESEFCFTTIRGTHFTPSSRAFHWKATRAAVGYTDTLYLATRHFAGWYMTNVLDLDSEVVAIVLGHEDGGELVRRLYGHRDKARALNAASNAYANHGSVTRLSAVRKENA